MFLPYLTTRCLRALLGSAALLATTALSAQAQTAPGVGIGTTAPDASAALEVVSSTKGALLPRLTEATRLAMGTGSVPAPAVGLIVYQTDGTSPGFYYAPTSSTWVRLGDDGTADAQYIQNQTAANQAASFRIGGTGYLGGALGLGTTSPAGQLANTADNIIGSDGYGTNTNSLSWEMNTIGYTAAIYNASTNGAARGLGIKIAGTGGALDITRGAAPNATAASLLRVNGTGYIGMGINSPANKLHVVTDNASGGSDDDYVFQSFGTASPGLVLQTARGTVAAPVNLVAGDNLGLIGFAGRFNGSTPFASAGISSKYRGTGTDDQSDLSFMTNSTEHLRLLPGGGLWMLNTNNNVLLTTGTTATPTGGSNVVLGNGAGATLGAGNSNILVGTNAGSGQNGNQNVMIGGATGAATSTAERNVLLGYASGNQTTGSRNTFLGYASGQSTSSGINNVALGHAAGISNTTGSSNTFLGGDTDANAANLTNATAIGYGTRVSMSNTVVLGTGASVGIGTPTPSGQLANTNGNTIGSDNQGGGGSSLNWAATQNGYVGQFYNGSPANNGNGLMVKIDGTNANAIAFDVSKGAQSTAGTSLLAVKANGNVHMSGLAGTGTRTVVTDAAGNLGTDTAANLDATTASNGLTKTGQDIALGGTLTQATTIANGGNELDITGPGNVGIGGSASGFKLGVTGQFRATATNGLFSVYNNSVQGGTVLLGAFDGASGAGPQLRFFGAGSGFMDIGENAAGDFVVEGSDTPRLTVQNGGNVGIGTPTPGQKLDVNGNVTVTGTIQLNTADTDKLFYTLAGAAGSKLGHAAGWGVLNYAGPGTGGTVGYHSWLTTGASTYAEQMRLSSTELNLLPNLRLGTDGAYGTTGNGSAIELDGPSVNSDLLGIYRANTGTNASELRVAVGDDPDGVVTGDKFVVGTTNAGGSVAGNLLNAGFNPHFAVLSNGNTGINTAAPAATLHVAGSTSTVRLEGLAGTGTRVVTADATGNLSSSTATTAFGTSFVQNTTTPQTADFNVSGAGTVGGLLTANGGATVTGTTTLAATTAAGSLNLNTTGSAATNIGTGTSAGAVTIGRLGGSTSLSGTTTVAGNTSINGGAGSGTTDIGTSTGAGAVTIGRLGGVTNLSGTTTVAGNTSINGGAGSGTTSIGTSTGAGAVTIGRSGGTVALPVLTTAGVVTTDALGNLGSSATVGSADATTASNGLNLNGQDVRLGGALTQPTTVSSITAANPLELTGTAAPLITNTTAAAATSTRVLGLRGGYSSAIAGSGAHLSFLEGSGNEVSRIAATQDAGSYLVGLSFSTANGTAGTVAERLRISPAGNVGIGISAPTSQLANTASSMAGSDGNGGGSSSLTWAGSQQGYVGLFYNGQATNARGLAVKVAGTDASPVLDVSSGAVQGTAGTSRLTVQANGAVKVGSLAGTGTRAVVADASGTVAPAAAGSILARLTSAQSGTAALNGSGASQPPLTAKTVTFPTAFGAAPTQVLVTVRTQDGQTYTDTFAATTKGITTTGFTVNIQRVDSNTNWSQQLLLDWIAIP